MLRKIIKNGTTQVTKHIKWSTITIQEADGNSDDFNVSCSVEP